MNVIDGDDEEVDFRELDDEPGKVYLFGTDISDINSEEIEHLHETVTAQFDEATVLIVGMPIEGSVVIETLDADDLQGVYDPAGLLEEVSDDG